MRCRKTLYVLSDSFNSQKSKLQSLLSSLRYFQTQKTPNRPTSPHLVPLSPPPPNPPRPGPRNLRLHKKGAAKVAGGASMPGERWRSDDTVAGKKPRISGSDARAAEQRGSLAGIRARRPPPARTSRSGARWGSAGWASRCCWPSRWRRTGRRTSRWPGRATPTAWGGRGSSTGSTQVWTTPAPAASISRLNIGSAARAEVRPPRNCSGLFCRARFMRSRGLRDRSSRLGRANFINSRTLASSFCLRRVRVGDGVGERRWGGCSYGGKCILETVLFVRRWWDLFSKFQIGIWWFL